MRWWTVANLLSNAGTWMQLTVQNLLVLQLTGSAAVTGLSLAVQAAPALLLGLVGGAVVDSWPRKVTAAVSQAALAAIAVATAVLLAVGVLNVPLLLVLGLLTGLVATVDGPACALLGNDLVPREDVPSAIAVGSVAHSVGRLGGVALAGLTFAPLGPVVAYAVNGVSFALVATAIPFLRPFPGAADDQDAPSPGHEADGRTRGGRGVRDGIGYFFGRPRLVALAAMCALSSLLGRNYQLTLASLVTGSLHAGPGAYGTVSAVLAVGGAAGAVLAGRLRRPTVRLVAWVTASGALLQATAALAPSLLPLLLLVLPMAVLESLSDTAVSTLLQTDPPAHLRGRVLGAWRSISTGWALGGPPLLGLLIQVLGARTALLTGGLVVAVAVAGGVLARRPSALPRVASAPA